jgi:hypothetical protein
MTSTIPVTMREKKRDASIEVIVVGILFALIFAMGSPVLGNNFGMGEKVSVVTAVPVAIEH